VPASAWYSGYVKTCSLTRLMSSPRAARAKDSVNTALYGISKQWQTEG
jgi:hypothetical protein